MSSQPARTLVALTSERRMLCESVLPMVTSLASFHARRGGAHSLDDLMSVGRYALVIAASTYDPSQGDFERWAYVSVATAILNARRKQAANAARERALVDYFDVLRGEDDLDLEESVQSRDPTSRSWTVRDASRRAHAAESSLLVSSTGDAESIYIERRTHEQAIEVLTTMERELDGHLGAFFRMRYREEMRVGDIAVALRVSPATTYRYADAVKRLVADAFTHAGLL